MAIAINLRGFNDLDVRNIFRWVIFSNDLSSRSLNFLQNVPSNSIHLTSSIHSAAVSNASLRVQVCENDGNI